MRAGGHVEDDESKPETRGRDDIRGSNHAAVVEGHVLAANQSASNFTSRDAESRRRGGVEFTGHAAELHAVAHGFRLGGTQREGRGGGGARANRARSLRGGGTDVVIGVDVRGTSLEGVRAEGSRRCASRGDHDHGGHRHDVVGERGRRRGFIRGRKRSRNRPDAATAHQRVHRACDERIRRRRGERGFETRGPDSSRDETVEGSSARRRFDSASDPSSSPRYFFCPQKRGGVGVKATPGLPAGGKDNAVVCDSPATTRREPRNRETEKPSARTKRRLGSLLRFVSSDAGRAPL